MAETIEARAPLESKELMRKFQELQTHLKNEPGKKSGQAATTRFAIKLAHEKLEELKDERNQAAQAYQEVKRELDQLSSDI